MRKLLPLLILLTAVYAKATTTLTINVTSFTGGTSPGASVRIDLQNCANARLLGTGQIVPQTQNITPVAGTAVVTLFSNTDGAGGGQILCQTPTGQQAVSYYSFSFVYQGVITSIGSYNLIPGTFVLANLTPCVGPACIGSGSGGATRIIAGHNITITPTNGLGQVTINSSGGGSGGNPSGLGTIQTSTADGFDFASFGQINSDASNTANNGISQTQATLCGVACSITVPPTSTDTEIPGPLPVLAGKVSSALNDKRSNSEGNYFTNPIPSNSQAIDLPGSGPGQNSQISIAAFTEPFPSGYSSSNFPSGFNQGSGQVLDSKFIQIAGGGYNLGPTNNAFPGLNPAAAGYPSASAWAFSGLLNRAGIFDNSGQTQMMTYRADFNGTGDKFVMEGQYFTAMGHNEPSSETSNIYSYHFSTHGNYEGTVSSSTDAYHIVTTATANAGTLGQGRFAFGSTPVFGNATANQIISPVGSDDTPSKVVFNGITLPISTARGTFTNQCNVPIQSTGVASVTCTVTVDAGFGIGHLVQTTGNSTAACAAYHEWNLTDEGMEIKSASAVSGGQQTLTLTMRRGLPAGAVIYQGGGCNLGIKWTADDSVGLNFEANKVSGSVFPCIGSTDAHTLLCPAYFASGQTYSTPLFPGTQAGTTELNVGHAGPGSSGFTANITRTSGVDSAILDLNNGDRRIWHDQVFFSVSGCTDTSFNGVKGSPSGNQAQMPGPDPNLVTYLDPGADSTCTGALMVPQGTLVDIVNIAEITDVENHASGVKPLQAVDGTIGMTYNPVLATPGTAITVPTHYAGGSAGILAKHQITQPQVEASTIAMQISSYSAWTGSAFDIEATTRQEEYLGGGGRGKPLNLFHLRGLFSTLNQSESAPTDAVNNIGGPSGIFSGPDANASLRDYKLWCLANTADSLCAYGETSHPDTESVGWFFEHSPVDQIVFNDELSQFLVPTGFTNAQFETNIGGTSNSGTYIPTTGISECTNFPTQTLPGPLSCYHRVLTNNAVVTQGGTPGSQRVVYALFGNDDDGLFGSAAYVTATSAATITPTNTNIIPCVDLPTGKTGTIYLATGTQLLPVGNCPNSSTIVTDIGTYGAGVGERPWIAGAPFYSGGFYGNVFAFLTSDQFGTSVDPSTVTASVTQTAPGVMSFNGSALNDGLGSITINDLVIHGTCTGAACPGGGGGGGVTSIDTLTGAFTFGGPGVSHSGNAYTFSGGGGGAVSSVFGRTGAVAATSGDYSFAQIATGTIGVNVGCGASCLITTASGGVINANELNSVLLTSLGTGLIKNTGGTFSIATAGTDYLTPTGNGSGLTALNGSNIASGTVNAARLPVFGTAAAGIVPLSGGGTTNFLRADGTWAAPAGGGTGTVTHTGNLTANAVMLGNGTADSKVDTGCSTDGAGNMSCLSFTTGGALQGLEAFSVGTGSLAGITLPTNYVGILGPASGTPAYFLALPNTNPTAGQTMVFAAPTTVNGVQQAVGTWATPGTGTVTAVSVATANGVSGTSSGGATPALTLSLGAITPTSTNGVSAATMAFVDPTSSIQTQLNGKQATLLTKVTTTVGTTAIGANTCATAVTVTMTGLASTNTLNFTPNSDVSAVTGWGATGGLTIAAWPTTNTVNYKVCNQTASSITPGGSVTFNVSAQ